MLIQTPSLKTSSISLTAVEENRPGIAVIGSGYWGKNLVRNFAELGVLHSICDKNELVLDQLKAQYGRVETCLAVNVLLARPDVKALAIATPAETHFTLAREALLAGKHVFIEKPMALKEEEGMELIGLAEKMGLTLMVGHLLRYHPAFVKLKELVTSGELGRINYIYSHRLNLGKIRREENILWSFAPHDISMILALAGEEPESVLTTGGNYLHRKIADVTTTHLEFSSGLRAHVFVSWLHPFKEQKLVVVGERKMAVFDDTLPWSDKLLLYSHELKWQNNIPVPTRAEAEHLVIEQKEPLRAECEELIECIRTGRRPITDGYEGLQVLKVLNASQRSLDKGRVKILIKESMGSVESHTFPLVTKAGTSSPIPEKRHDIAPTYPDFFIHPTALLDESIRVGVGTKIWHFTHILSGSVIGDHCSIGQNVVIGPDVCIGNGCRIQNNVSIYKGVTLEDDIFVGPSVVFTNVLNPRAFIGRMDEIRPTHVRRGASLGANCTIVCGNPIGRYAFIGAGAVITREVPDHALMLGNPARWAGWICRCGERLPAELKCPSCGLEYEELDKCRLVLCVSLCS